MCCSANRSSPHLDTAAVDTGVEIVEYITVNNRISISPQICHGKPVITGTRVLVSTLLGALAGGDSVDTILADYPNISKEDVEAALTLASKLSNFQELAYKPAS